MLELTKSVMLQTDSHLLVNSVVRMSPEIQCTFLINKNLILNVIINI